MDPDPVESNNIICRIRTRIRILMQNLKGINWFCSLDKKFVFYKENQKAPNFKTITDVLDSSRKVKKEVVSKRSEMI